MRIFKNLIIAFLFLVAVSPSVFGAPTLPDPGWEDSIASSFTRITGDYGPRNFTDQKEKDTNPHIGIV